MKRTTTPQDVEHRREDIISACESLFGVLDYQDINLKAISQRTELSRPSLYNYFRTKEEIFLALADRYLASFMKDIRENILNARHDKKELARIFTTILLRHFKFIEIVSVHMTDLETHTPLASLVAFKKHYKAFLELLVQAMLSQYPKADREKIDFFCQAFVASLHGIYPMTTPCKEQVEAMAIAGYKMPFSKEEFIFKTMELLLSLFDKE